MDQQLVAWMLSGGTRVERREERLQRVHRAELRMAATPTAGLTRGWLASVAASLGRRERAPEALVTQCCPA